MSNLLALALATAVLVAIPGPNVALTVANSLSYGFRAGVVTVAGAVFGVGFFREWYTAKSQRRRDYMERKYRNRRQKDARQPEPASVAPPEEARRRMLVRRAHFTTIVAAWVITVPAAAILSAVTFILLDAAF